MSGRWVNEAGRQRWRDDTGWESPIRHDRYVGWLMRLNARLRDFGCELDSANGPTSEQALECWRAGLHPYEAFVDLTGICVGYDDSERTWQGPYRYAAGEGWWAA